MGVDSAPARRVRLCGRRRSRAGPGPCHTIRLVWLAEPGAVSCGRTGPEPDPHGDHFAVHPIACIDGVFFTRLVEFSFFLHFLSFFVLSIHFSCINNLICFCYVQVLWFICYGWFIFCTTRAFLLIFHL